MVGTLNLNSPTGPHTHCQGIRQSFEGRIKGRLVKDARILNLNAFKHTVLECRNQLLWKFRC